MVYLVLITHTYFIAAVINHRPRSLYAIDGERCSCDVSGHYTLPDSWGRRLKYLPLLICEENKNNRLFFFFFFHSSIAQKYFDLTRKSYIQSPSQWIRHDSCCRLFTSGHGSIEGQDKEALHCLVLDIVAVVNRLSFLKQQVTGALNLWLTCQTWRINVAVFVKVKMYTEILGLHNDDLPVKNTRISPASSLVCTSRAILTTWGAN